MMHQAPMFAVIHVANGLQVLIHKKRKKDQQMTDDDEKFYNCINQFDIETN